MGAIVVAGAVGLVLAGYWAAARADIDGTTEAAALVVVAAGVCTGIGNWALASGMVAVTAVLLVEKGRLHAWSRAASEEGLRSGFHFALMALVVLPLLPEGPYGPAPGFRPKELWIVVLLLSGLSFLGYAAGLMWGRGRGAVIAGLLGGLVSSTNVTIVFSRKSREGTQPARALAAGVLAACTILFLRVGVVSWVLNPELGRAVWPYLAAPLLLGSVGIGFVLSRPSEGEFETVKNPLGLISALQMAVLFQVVLYILEAVKGRLGESGLVASGALLGLTDVDALTLSMARLAEADGKAGVPALAVAVGCLANTLFKTVVALAVGMGEYRRWAAGLLIALAAVLAAGIWAGEAWR
jgi:uncharacterized membrane protein (DUF4010 family)